MRFTVSCGVAVLALVLSATPLSATASDDESGNWWYERFGVAEVQAEGWTGEGVKVAVLDSQINPDIPVFAGASLTVADPPICDVPASSPELTKNALHGSSVTAMIIGTGEGAGAVRGIAPRADVTFYGYGETGNLCRTNDDRSPWGIAIDRAVADGAQIISTSTIFAEQTDDDIESVAAALAAGVVIVAGMPNGTTAEDTATDMPTSLNGVVSVAAFRPDGAIAIDDVTGLANIHSEVTVVAPGYGIASANWEQEQLVGGTSVATPLVAGILAATWQKYPDATGNQLVQSLIHNTRAEDHPLERDMASGYGYGPVSLRHMLAVDPTQYPDENPLMNKTSGVPTLAQVTAAAAPSPEPTASVEPSVPDDGGESGGADIGLLVGGGVALLAALAAIVIILVTVNRRRTRTPNGESS